MPKQESILIIGAGLCGSLLALRLGQRGFKVHVVEMRPDLRTVDISAGRSINLAFSNRGLKAIKLVGLESKVKSLCIPMHGRMVHDSDGNTFISNYSGREDESINSISRELLTALLLDEAEALENVTIEFQKLCTDVDFDNKKASFEDAVSGTGSTISADLIFGTDGAGSALRKSYFKERKFLFSFSQNYLTHGYKELTIQPDKKGDFKTYKNALHIWPRGDFMIIALPNLNGSFTVTLFLSYESGTYNFNNLTTPEIVTEFFEKEFPDALELMPNLAVEFFENPTAPLGTVKCFPWNYKGHSLLLGDSAHAIVPFYGQGMNASFEDVVEFDAFLDTHEGNWEATFKDFQNHRKIDTDGIADLAIDNFHEMKDHVANPIFQEKRKIEMALEAEFPEVYHSKYSLVTFKETIGYNEAMTIGRAQDKAILSMLASNKVNLKEPLKEVLRKVQEETSNILVEDTIARTFKY
ncbi:FAD-dependent monooxygenase [Flavobacteriaceae bacterium]|nr:FAD-dependent monooxygenase [Flavobacteriaceae bacterium]MDA9026087.1 FAD-dependent monooxygenase [Flavobacteriaceae bacterium]